MQVNPPPALLTPDKLPKGAALLLRRLEGAGFEAYTVGGCVRDTLLGKTPSDWDLCTSASPDEIRSLFSGFRVIETGAKHGTLTVLSEGRPFEITTFRSDGEYSDFRHPKQVTFVRSLHEDLLRRDFTINAMAYSPSAGLIDYCGGVQDLREGIIRCVGIPTKRFEEDALRVLRALRFASVYDFSIEPATSDALRALSRNLEHIAAERVREELFRLLCGSGAGTILRTYPDVLSLIIPAIGPMIGYDQNNHHHRYDLWEHTVRSIEAVPPDIILRLTMLLHDTGKPRARASDDTGECHFFGHAEYSSAIADETLRNLKSDRETLERVTILVRYHDIPLDTSERSLLRMLNRFGQRELISLIHIRHADSIATGTVSAENADREERDTLEALRVLLDRKPCFSLRSLAVNGNDLLALGLSGKDIGKVLQTLLDGVMSGEIENKRDMLLSALKRDKSIFKIN